jgi:hypothetical protein
MGMKSIIATLWSKQTTELEDADDKSLTVENAYKTRWVWYHTILGIELMIVILIQLGILVLLAAKL